ncbi:hypothetical protein PMAYCL1PPCAC_19808, partial [Pristionchus mayeri]
PHQPRANPYLRLSRLSPLPIITPSCLQRKSRAKMMRFGGDALYSSSDWWREQQETALPPLPQQQQHLLHVQQQSLQQPQQRGVLLTPYGSSMQQQQMQGYDDRGPILFEPMKMMDEYSNAGSDNDLLMRLQDATRQDTHESRVIRVERASPPAGTARPVLKRDRGAIGITQKCSVCEVMTNGFHFGAVSCAACSAFFRRTVAENRSYVCRKEGDEHLKCPINQSARCYCRACRMQKCLNAGMDPAAVQPHRDMIGSKRRKTSGDETPRVSMDSPMEGGETLADHLKMNREYSRALKAREGYGGVVRRADKISPTAHLLTSPNVLAEQLLAFSRQPVIASTANHLRGDETAAAAASIAGSNRLGAVPTSLSDAVNGAGMSAQEGVIHHPANNHSILGVKSVEEQVNGSLHEAASSSNGGSGHTPIHKQEIEDAPLVYEFEEEVTQEEIDASADRRRSMGEDSVAASLINDHFICTPDPTQPNWIETLVEMYGRLRERRRLIYCPPTIRDILGGTRPRTHCRVVTQPGLCAIHTFFAVTITSESREESFYDRIKDKMRVEIGLVAELLMSVPNFTTVPLDDQVLLFKNVSCYFNVMEKHYFTMLHGGVKLNRIIHNDLSYTDLDAKQFPVFRSEKDETMTDDMLVSLFINPLKHSLHILAGAMEKMQMSDVEFCGLVAVLLFDSTIAGLSEEGRAIVAESRDRAYKDWFAYYRMQGRSRDDAAQRVGETLLLIPAIQSTAELSKENFHLIRVFQIFEYDNLLDDVFNVSSSPDNQKVPENAETDADAAKIIEEKRRALNPAQGPPKEETTPEEPVEPSTP